MVKLDSAKLDSADREILMLGEHEQLAYSQIAELMRLPLNTVRSWLFRARLGTEEPLDGGRVLSVCP